MNVAPPPVKKGEGRGLKALLTPLSTIVQIHSSSAAHIADQAAFDNQNKSSSDDKSGYGGGGPSSASPA